MFSGTLYIATKQKRHSVRGAADKRDRWSCNLYVSSGRKKQHLRCRGQPTPLSEIIHCHSSKLCDSFQYRLHAGIYGWLSSPINICVVCLPPMKTSWSLWPRKDSEEFNSVSGFSERNILFKTAPCVASQLTVGSRFTEEYKHAITLLLSTEEGHLISWTRKSLIYAANQEREAYHVDKWPGEWKTFFISTISYWIDVTLQRSHINIIAAIKAISWKLIDSLVQFRMIAAGLCLWTIWFPKRGLSFKDISHFQLCWILLEKLA